MKSNISIPKSDTIKVKFYTFKSKIVSLIIIIITFTYKDMIVHSLDFFKCINVGDEFF